MGGLLLLGIPNQPSWECSRFEPASSAPEVDTMVTALLYINDNLGHTVPICMVREVGIKPNFAFIGLGAINGEKGRKKFSACVTTPHTHTHVNKHNRV
jgi:hypothetical protein